MVDELRGTPRMVRRVRDIERDRRKLEKCLEEGGHDARNLPFVY